jgi:multimeric flavodoxin WrbA
MTVFERRGVDTELITLKDEDIKICDGCMACAQSGICHLNDDMQMIYGKILAADAVVFGSPTYMHAPTALSLAFIHRMGPLFGKIKGKGFGSVVVGQIPGREGEESRGKVEEYFGVIAALFGMENAGSLSVVAAGPKDASRAPGMRDECEKLASRILGSDTGVPPSQ